MREWRHVRERKRKRRAQEGFPSRSVSKAGPRGCAPGRRYACVSAWFTHSSCVAAAARAAAQSGACKRRDAKTERRAECAALRERTPAPMQRRASARRACVQACRRSANAPGLVR